MGGVRVGGRRRGRRWRYIRGGWSHEGRMARRYQLVGALESATRTAREIERLDGMIFEMCKKIMKRGRMSVEEK